ncbi:TRAP transporter small permease [Rhodococcus rhodochrous]|uniref:TRAP transporter small permease n=1 Tax=Rhodococcus rhodochrous TaxID=1829 RepID=UPI0002D3B86C|nr:TRAP transporter small permease [Rhodococcus rhodochrous]
MTETTTVHAFRKGDARRTTFGYLTDDHPKLDRVQNAVSAVCGVIAGVSIVAIVLLTLLEVSSRVLFSAPQGWSVSVIEKYLMTATAFFGMVTAYRSGSHIAVVSLFNRFGPRTQKSLLVLAYIIVFIGMAVMGIAGLTATVFAISTGESPVPGASELFVPSWLWRSIVPVSMALGCLVVLIDLFREVFSPWAGPVTDYDPGDEVDAVLSEIDGLSQTEKGTDR